MTPASFFFGSTAWTAAGQHMALAGRISPETAPVRNYIVSGTSASECAEPCLSVSVYATGKTHNPEQAPVNHVHASAGLQTGGATRYGEYGESLSSARTVQSRHPRHKVHPRRRHTSTHSGRRSTHSGHRGAKERQPPPRSTPRAALTNTCNTQASTQMPRTHSPGRAVPRQAPLHAVEQMRSARQWHTHSPTPHWGGG